MGWTFLLALVAGLPCALLADSFIHRATTVVVIDGRLFVNDRGQLDGFALHGTGTPEGWEQARPYGEFAVTVTNDAWGWPSASREDPAATQLSVKRFDALGANVGREREAIRRVVDRALMLRVDIDRRLVLASFDAATGTRKQPPLELIHLAFNTLIAWPILYAIGSAVIFMAWVAHGLRAHAQTTHRRSLRARGLCPACRHRVDGNLWSAKCPECGEPLY